MHGLKMFSLVVILRIFLVNARGIRSNLILDKVQVTVLYSIENVTLSYDSGSSSSLKEK